MFTFPASDIPCFLGQYEGASHFCTGQGVIWLNGKALDRERWDGEFVCQACLNVFEANSEAYLLEFDQQDADAHAGSAGTAVRWGTHSSFVNHEEVEFYDLWDLVG